MIVNCILLLFTFSISSILSYNDIIVSDIPPYSILVDAHASFAPWIDNSFFGPVNSLTQPTCNPFIVFSFSVFFIEWNLRLSFQAPFSALLTHEFCKDDREGLHSGELPDTTGFSITAVIRWEIDYFILIILLENLIQFYICYNTTFTNLENWFGLHVLQEPYCQIQHFPFEFWYNLIVFDFHIERCVSEFRLKFKKNKFLIVASPKS